MVRPAYPLGVDERPVSLVCGALARWRTGNVDAPLDGPERDIIDWLREHWPGRATFKLGEHGDRVCSEQASRLLAAGIVEREVDAVQIDGEHVEVATFKLARDVLPDWCRVPDAN
jgi:hypothetical protein